MSGLGRAEKILRKQAMSYPGVTEEFPWGHRALKVKGKAFAFLTYERHALSLSVKLPTSNGEALMMPFAEPTHYGLGKSGWVTSSFGESDEIPLEMLGGWIDESYRAIAPRKLVAAMAEKAAAGRPASRGVSKTRKTALRVKGSTARGAGAKTRKTASRAKTAAAGVARTKTRKTGSTRSRP